MSEILPKIAERLFALRCSEAGVTCNGSSDEDTAGWDYVVHFPQGPDDSRPRDEQSGAETAFVQIKSTASSPLAVSLKLSNALRMAKENHPYFLVLIVGTQNPYHIFARHFWAEEIEHTLRRVRQSEVSGHRDRLNRRKLTLKFTDKDEHTNDLLSWMHSTIRAVRGDYPTAKTAITNSVGYDKNSTKISLTLEGSPEEIIDWELGLRSIPTVSSFKMTRKRFGIELPVAALDASKILIAPDGQPCLVALRHRTEATNVTLAGKLYASALPTHSEHRPWRADLGCMTLTWRSGELRSCFQPDFNERMSLPLLLDRLTLGGWSGKGAISGTLFTGSARIELGTLDLPGCQEDDEGWKEIASWTRTLRTIVEAHPGNEPRISISDLLKSGPWLKRFHELFAAPMRIEHNPNESDDPTHAIIYRLRCDIGGWCFLVIARREVPVDTVIDGRRTLYLKPAELLEAYALKGHWSDHIEHILPAYERHVRAMGDPTYFWDLGDMEDWLAKRCVESDT